MLEKKKKKKKYSMLEKHGVLMMGSLGSLVSLMMLLVIGSLIVTNNFNEDVGGWMCITLFIREVLTIVLGLFKFKR